MGIQSRSKTEGNYCTRFITIVKMISRESLESSILLTLNPRAVQYQCASFNGHQTVGHSIKTAVVQAKAEHQPLAAVKLTLAELGRSLVDDYFLRLITLVIQDLIEFKFVLKYLIFSLLNIHLFF